MDDPLNINNLALHLDYLTFKLSDELLTLTERVESTLTTKNEAINAHLQSFSSTSSSIDSLLKQTINLENEFGKLNSIYEFVSDFKKRLEGLEMEFARR